MTGRRAHLQTCDSRPTATGVSIWVADLRQASFVLSLLAALLTGSAACEALSMDNPGGSGSPASANKEPFGQACAWKTAGDRLPALDRECKPVACLKGVKNAAQYWCFPNAPEAHGMKTCLPKGCRGATDDLKAYCYEVRMAVEPNGWMTPQEKVGVTPTTKYTDDDLCGGPCSQAILSIDLHAGADSAKLVELSKAGIERQMRLTGNFSVEDPLTNELPLSLTATVRPGASCSVEGLLSDDGKSLWGRVWGADLQTAFSTSKLACLSSEGRRMAYLELAIKKTDC